MISARRLLPTASVRKASTTSSWSASKGRRWLPASRAAPSRFPRHSRNRNPDCRRTGRGPPGRHRAPGPEAGQRDARPVCRRRGVSQVVGLRTGAPGAACATGSRDRCGECFGDAPGNGAVYVAGAGGRPDTRRPGRPFCLRGRPLRDAHWPAGVPRREHGDPDRGHPRARASRGIVAGADHSSRG